MNPESAVSQQCTIRSDFLALYHANVMKVDGPVPVSDRLTTAVREVHLGQAGDATVVVILDCLVFDLQIVSNVRNNRFKGAR